MTQTHNPEVKSLKNLNFLLHFCFFISGFATVLVGQVLPVLSKRFSLNDGEAAFFFTAQLSGSICGTLINSQLSKRIGFSKASAAGCIAMAIGILGLNAGSWPLCLGAFFLNGIGIGFTLPSVNMLVAELNPTNTNYALNFLNFFWGFGAILCKPFVDYAGYGGSILIPTSILAVTLVATGLSLAFASYAHRPGYSSNSTAENYSPPVWTTPTAWLIALFTFIQVGFESAIGGWITTYTNRLSGDDTVTWLSPTLAYFFFFVIGRLIAPLITLRLRENSMLFIGIFVLILGSGLVVSAQGFNSLLLGAAVSGLGTSYLFPTNMSRFTRIFGEESTRKVTPLFVCGSLGSAFTAWLVGYISFLYNDLRTGMFVLLVSCVSLVVLQTVLAIIAQKKRGKSI